MPTKVTIIHRRDEFRASKIMQERVLANEKIEVLWNTEVREILGSQEEGVTGVKIYNNETNEESEYPTKGVFVAIGHKPNTDLFKDWLEMDDVGYLKTKGSTMETNIPGVFASGDAQDSYYRQAVTAAGTGCMAAIDAERFLVEHGEKEGNGDGNELVKSMSKKEADEIDIFLLLFFVISYYFGF